MGYKTSLVAQTVKRLSAIWEIRVRSLGWEDPLEKEMTMHSSTIAWKIPQTEEPGRLQSVGSQRVRHDWATNTHHVKWWIRLFFGLWRRDSHETSLVVQWLRICLAMPKTWVLSLFRELRSHILQSNWACILQLLSTCSRTRESLHFNEGPYMTQTRPKAAK